MNAAVRRALDSYAETKYEASISFADQHTLVAMLFSGLLDSLISVKKALMAEDLMAKSAAVTKAQGILLGLSTTLDFENGGEIASDLAALYDYCLRALVKIQVENDLSRLQEVIRIITTLESAWGSIPEDTRHNFGSQL